MRKTIAVSVVVGILAITLAAIYFYPIGDDSQYCNHALNWDGCNEKVIKISGSNPDAGNGVIQHPMMTIPPETLGNNSKQYQGYLDTALRGQIVLLSDEIINCPNKMTIIGTLKTDVGPCDADTPDKNMYCGSSITVNQWECH